MQIVNARSSFVILCLLSVSVAGYAVVAYGFLPLGSLVHPDMSVVFQANKTGIYAHVFGAAVALALGTAAGVVLAVMLTAVGLWRAWGLWRSWRETGSGPR